MRRRSRVLTVLGLLAAGWLVPTMAESQDTRTGRSPAISFNELAAICFDPQSKPDVVIGACDRLIARKGTKGRDVVHSSRGAAFARAGQHDRAIADFDQAIRLNPKNVEGYDGRGGSRAAKGENDLAIVDYNEAIRLDPTRAASYASRGMVWMKVGQYDRALGDFDEAIRLAPFVSIYHSVRGYSRHAKGEYDAAFAGYEAALRLNPNDATAYGGRGESRFATRDFDGAIADFDQAIRLNPEHAIYYRNRGLSLQAKNDHERALADLDRAIGLGATDVLSYSGRAHSLLAMRNFAGAIADYDKALSIAPQFAHAYLGRGMAYEGAGDMTKAHADYRAALAIESGDGIEEVHVKANEHLAKTMPSMPAVAASTGRRVALVIGNGAYRNVPTLLNPVRDATQIAASLRRVGFQSVTLVNDLGREQLIAALRAFAAEADTADWATIYFSGHGMEAGGKNYLVPIDAKLESDRDLEFEAVPLHQLLGTTEGARKLRLVLLDACRDNPFLDRMKVKTATRSIGRGLSLIEPEPSTLVVYAAKHGQVAYDGDGQNSPFALALAKWIETPNIEIRKLFDLVRDDVMDATERRQQPFSYGSISGREDFFFSATKKQ